MQLSRVGKAISKFISPISSSRGATTASAEKPFQKFTPPIDPGPSKDQKQPPNPPGSPEGTLTSAESQAEGSPSSPATSGITAAFLQLMAKVQTHRSVLLRWLASHTYERATKRQKKSSRFRKGAMLDHIVK